MTPFKFFGENLRKIPKTRDEVRSIVTEQCVLLYENLPDIEVRIETMVDEICRHLNISD